MSAIHDVHRPSSDANSGEPWSEADISDLKNKIDRGRTIAETASFLCRDVDEVRAKMKEFGLTAGKKNIRPLEQVAPQSD